MFHSGFETEDGFECKSLSTTPKPSTLQPNECQLMILPQLTMGTWMCSNGNKYCSFSCDPNLKEWVILESKVNYMVLKYPSKAIKTVFYCLPMY